MDLISKKAQLGLNAALFIAYHARKNTPIAGATIAEHYNLSSRALEPVLQILGNAGLLQSIRGYSGGYYIEQPSKVSIKNILQCFTDNKAANNSAFTEFSSILETSLKESHQCFWDKLSKITVQDLCDASKEKNLPKLPNDILLFEI